MAVPTALAATAAPSPSTTTEWTPGPGAGRLLAQQAQRARAWAALDLPPRLRACRLETYPVAESVALTKAQTWLRPGTEASGLLLHGPAGRGKTGIALGLLRELMADDGHNVAFAVVPELLDELRRASRPDSEIDADALLTRYKRRQVLVLDDIGTERVNEFVRERLYMLVHARHRDPKLLTIFTSNLAPSALEDRLGERIAWRIVEMSEVVKVDGPNLRDRKAS
jgi:DNA replication protein DnaC